MITVLMDRYSETGEELQQTLSEYDAELHGVINWTGRPAKPEEVGEQKCLNLHSRTDKLAQLIRLDHQGVRVVPYALSKPEGDRWLPRTILHQQGRDFTTKKPFEPDYWTKWMPFEDEWRIHVFKQNCGKVAVLRSGLKLPRCKPFHPWVKSHRLGWKLSYIGGAPETAKSAARAALNALQLDFAAVDLALTPAGEVYILEVNTCPGLEGGTLDKYLDQIEERLK